MYAFLHHILHQEALYDDAEPVLRYIAQSPAYPTYVFKFDSESPILCMWSRTPLSALLLNATADSSALEIETPTLSNARAVARDNEGKTWYVEDNSLYAGTDTVSTIPAGLVATRLSVQFTAVESARLVLVSMASNALLAYRVDSSNLVTALSTDAIADSVGAVSVNSASLVTWSNFRAQIWNVAASESFPRLARTILVTLPLVDGAMTDSHVVLAHPHKISVYGTDSDRPQFDVELGASIRAIGWNATFFAVHTDSPVVPASAVSKMLTADSTTICRIARTHALPNVPTVRVNKGFPPTDATTSTKSTAAKALTLAISKISAYDVLAIDSTADNVVWGDRVGQVLWKKADDSSPITALGSLFGSIKCICIVSDSCLVSSDTNDGALFQFTFASPPPKKLIRVFLGTSPIWGIVCTQTYVYVGVEKTVFRIKKAENLEDKSMWKPFSSYRDPINPINLAASNDSIAVLTTAGVDVLDESGNTPQTLKSNNTTAIYYDGANFNPYTPTFDSEPFILSRSLDATGGCGGIVIWKKKILHSDERIRPVTDIIAKNSHLFPIVLFRKLAEILSLSPFEFVPDMKDYNAIHRVLRDFELTTFDEFYKSTSQPDLPAIAEACRTVSGAKSLVPAAFLKTELEALFSVERSKRQTQAAQTERNVTGQLAVFTPTEMHRVTTSAGSAFSVNNRMKTLLCFTPPFTKLRQISTDVTDESINYVALSADAIVYFSGKSMTLVAEPDVRKTIDTPFTETPLLISVFSSDPSRTATVVACSNQKLYEWTFTLSDSYEHTSVDPVAFELPAGVNPTTPTVFCSRHFNDKAYYGIQVAFSPLEGKCVGFVEYAANLYAISENEALMRLTGETETFNSKKAASDFKIRAANDEIIVFSKEAQLQIFKTANLIQYYTFSLDSVPTTTPYSIQSLRLSAYDGTGVQAVSLPSLTSTSAYVLEKDVGEVLGSSRLSYWTLNSGEDPPVTAKIVYGAGQQTPRSIQAEYAYFYSFLENDEFLSDALKRPLMLNLNELASLTVSFTPETAFGAYVGDVKTRATDKVAMFKRNATSTTIDARNRGLFRFKARHLKSIVEAYDRSDEPYLQKTKTFLTDVSLYIYADPYFEQQKPRWAPLLIDCFVELAQNIDAPITLKTDSLPFSIAEKALLTAIAALGAIADTSPAATPELQDCVQKFYDALCDDLEQSQLTFNLFAWLFDIGITNAQRLEWALSFNPPRKWEEATEKIGHTMFSYDFSRPPVRGEPQYTNILQLSSAGSQGNPSLLQCPVDQIFVACRPHPARLPPHFNPYGGGDNVVVDRHGALWTARPGFTAAELRDVVRYPNCLDNSTYRAVDDGAWGFPNGCSEAGRYELIRPRLSPLADGLGRALPAAYFDRLKANVGVDAVAHQLLDDAAPMILWLHECGQDLLSDFAATAVDVDPAECIRRCAFATKRFEWPDNLETCKHMRQVADGILLHSGVAVEAYWTHLRLHRLNHLPLDHRSHWRDIVSFWIAHWALMIDPAIDLPPNTASTTRTIQYAADGTYSRILYIKGTMVAKAADSALFAPLSQTDLQELKAEGLYRYARLLDGRPVQYRDPIAAVATNMFLRLSGGAGADTDVLAMTQVVIGLGDLDLSAAITFTPSATDLQLKLPILATEDAAEYFGTPPSLPVVSHKPRQKASFRLFSELRSVDIGALQSWNGDPDRETKTPPSRRPYVAWAAARTLGSDANLDKLSLSKQREKLMGVARIHGNITLNPNSLATYRQQLRTQLETLSGNLLDHEAPLQFGNVRALPTESEAGQQVSTQPRNMKQMLYSLQQSAQLTELPPRVIDLFFTAQAQYNDTIDLHLERNQDDPVLTHLNQYLQNGTLPTDGVD
ncbi:MAG: hypothetical protein CL678_15715 [Bdellovibrionaceae bacterium]|nr:hypothetical protein [Pseudobdellovibrionaceae bacterium]